MKRWKRYLLFCFATGFTILVVIIAVGIAYLNAPVDVSSLDPKTVLDAPNLETRPLSDRPLAKKEHIDLLASAPEKRSDSTYERDAKPFLEALLKMKERDGRDNALIYYETASWLLPQNAMLPESSASNPQRDWRELVNEALRAGWRPPVSDELRSHLKAWKPALDKMREGAAVDYAKGVGATGDPYPCSFNSPFAVDFPVVQFSSKMLCLEGRRLEAEGAPQDGLSKALDEYLAALTVGRDCTTSGNLLMSHLVGMAIERTALRQLDRVACEGRLSEADILRSLKRIREIEATTGSLADAFALKDANLLDVCRQVLEDPKQIAKITEMPYCSLWEAVTSWNSDVRSRFLAQTVFRFYIRHNASRIGPDMREIHALKEKLLKEPGWRDAAPIEKELEGKFEKAHVFIQITQTNTAEPRMRHLSMIATLRETQVAFALLTAA